MRILLGHRQAMAVAVLVVLAMGLAAGPTASTARTAPTGHITLKLTKRTGKKKVILTHTGRATGPIAGRVRAKSTLLSRVVWRGTLRHRHQARHLAREDRRPRAIACASVAVYGDRDAQGRHRPLRQRSWRRTVQGHLQPLDRGGDDRHDHRVPLLSGGPR